MILSTSDSRMHCFAASHSHYIPFNSHENWILRFRERFEIKRGYSGCSAHPPLSLHVPKGCLKLIQAMQSYWDIHFGGPHNPQVHLGRGADAAHLIFKAKVAASASVDTREVKWEKNVLNNSEHTSDPRAVFLKYQISGILRGSWVGFQGRS